ncbi:MAG: hypothetical protein IJT61_00825, partial [Bacteroidales bacterium]|nr:hypothetical protein [Bacteroidales bacterium]
MIDLEDLKDFSPTATQTPRQPRWHPRRGPGDRLNADGTRTRDNKHHHNIKKSNDNENKHHKILREGSGDARLPAKA